jgi:hypothetical protein
MLALLVPGVGMGASDPVAPAVTDHHLSIMGVGHSWLLPLLLSMIGFAYGL